MPKHQSVLSVTVYFENSKLDITEITDITEILHEYKKKEKKETDPDL